MRHKLGRNIDLSGWIKRNGPSHFAVGAGFDYDDESEVPIEQTRELTIMRSLSYGLAFRKRQDEMGCFGLGRGCIATVKWRLFGAIFGCWLMYGSHAIAQLPTGWKAHDWDRARPPVVSPGQASLPVAAPSDAVVLFDGKNLDAWRANDGGPAKWIVKDNVMESVPGSGYVYTAQAFGDVQLHVEWAAPAKVEGKSQGRGNSGVFLQGLFEIQVLDSFDNITYADGQAGALYGQYPPLVNASRKPGEWQSYDIIYRRPHFQDDGKLLQPARLTVLHNGVLIQDNVRALGPTSWIQHGSYQKVPEKLPLSFQDHGNPVRYRNVWVRELPPETIVQPEKPYDPVIVLLTPEQQAKIAGKYSRNNGGIWEITQKDGKLFFSFIAVPLELIPHSPQEFGIKYTAGKLTLTYDQSGTPKDLEFHMGGEIMKASRSN
ncbi:MAG: DUF1080 domain-containing protein [Pirellula sp.]